MHLERIFQAQTPKPSAETTYAPLATIRARSFRAKESFFTHLCGFQGIGLRRETNEESQGSGWIPRSMPSSFQDFCRQMIQKRTSDWKLNHGWSHHLYIHFERNFFWVDCLSCRSKSK